MKMVIFIREKGILLFMLLSVFLRAVHGDKHRENENVYFYKGKGYFFIHIIDVNQA